jgi:outer membrane protein OmpA-like peptidoglycan-associated protein
MRLPSVSAVLKHLCAAAATLALLVGAGMLSPARAGDNTDCPPIGTLPDYLPVGPAEHHEFQSYDFEHKTDDGGSDRVTVAGKYCGQQYNLKEGAEQMSAVEMVDNFLDTFDQLGAKVVYQDDSDATAVLTGDDGRETWIEAYGDGGYFRVFTVVKQPVTLTLTKPSGKDYRLLGHMPNYQISNADHSKFDRYTFSIRDGDDMKAVKVDGATYNLEYAPKDGAQEAAPIELLANYKNAFEKMGAQTLFSDDTSIVARYDDKGQAIWMMYNDNGGDIDIHVVEEKAFHPSMKPPKADAMKSALDKKGVVSLYINFDFDKATLRPDAAPIVAQVEALLKGDPELKLDIEGNTDNVGGHDYNVTLSQKRAETVVATLEKDGIAEDRLKATGNGPDKPIADNGDSRGRAKNRRVDLVKM